MGFTRSIFCSTLCIPQLGHTPACDEREQAAVDRSIHDEEVNAARERVAGGWVARARANDLPTFSTHQSAYAFMPEGEARAMDGNR